MERTELPIAVFDSGLGGISVLRALVQRMPGEDFLYFGDSANAPYGVRPAAEVRRLTQDVIARLYDRGIKAAVIACNTATAAALPALRETWPDMPIIGVIEPGSRAACEASPSGDIAVIATESTIRSGAYAEAILRRRPDAQVRSLACPLFVPLVEAGYVDHSAPDKQQITKLVIAQYLTEIRDAGVDTLILGCTHYPLLKTMIGEFMGRDVVLIDPAKTAAHRLEQMLAERGLRGDHPTGQAHFFVSDVPDSFAQTADLFLGEYKGGPIDQIAIDKY